MHADQRRDDGSPCRVHGRARRAMALCSRRSPSRRRCRRSPTYAPLSPRPKPNSSTAMAPCWPTQRADPRIRRLDWIPLADVSPVVATTLIAAEDRRFYEHAGVDWPGFASAAWDSVWRSLDGRGPRGASTLSMQLAGLLDPALAIAGNSRTLGQKWDQAQAALALERTWTKRQIIEAYLNVTTYRGELTGIDAAARGLFGKSPAGLDAREAAILVALQRGPNAPAVTVAQRACAVAAIAAPQLACEDVRASAMVALAGAYRLGAAREPCAASGGEAVEDARRTRSRPRSTPTCNATPSTCCATISPSSPTARSATAPSSCSITPPATCWRGSAAAVNCLLRHKSTASSRHARRDRRSSLFSTRRRSTLACLPPHRWSMTARWRSPRSAALTFRRTTTAVFAAR